MKPDPVAVNTMFGRIAHRYDLANRILSMGLDLRWRGRLVAAVRRSHPGDVLDLATGSGDVAFALSRGLAREVRITGVDFCQPMLDLAEKKKEAAAPGRYANVAFAAGDALELPLLAASFDAVTLAFGLRNMADRPRCLAEIRRVLRPGGSLVVLEFSQPYAWFQPIYAFYLLRITPWIAGALTGNRDAYRYLGESIGGFPGREPLSDEIRAAGFSEVKASAMTCGIVALHEARC